MVTKIADALNRFEWLGWYVAVIMALTLAFSVVNNLAMQAAGMCK